MTATQIPDKFHFKIGEVSRILGVKPYVLRFWETEFRITPAKNRSQHRVYNRQEVETLLEIKQLLYEERFTIEGARVKLKERAKDRQKQ
ncbi:MAG TPA: MerR family transcriptional regulator, partial [Desulfobacteria bacterium]|nr:MerR family transcriptional regulator [Desulfobacteria bacterium]